MKLKPLFQLSILSLSMLFLVACGGGSTGGGQGGGASSGVKKQASQDEVKRALRNVNNPADKETSVLGKRIAETKGDISYGLPGGIDSMVFALTPYEQGFKVFFHSLLSDRPKDDQEHVCDEGFVVQNGNVFSMGRIADNQNEFANDNSSEAPYLYKGYIESGVTDSCSHYNKDTVWVVSADYIEGFNPLQPYTFILTGVSSVHYDDLGMIDISINGKKDNTKTDLKYLGEKRGESVTKTGYKRGYPSKEFAFNATITPYDKGFRVFVPRNDSQMCFSIDSDVYQDGARYEIGIISDSWYSFFASANNDNAGYVESGFYDSCSELPVDTTYVVKASNVGFNPKRPYTVKLGGVKKDPFTDTRQRQAFEIKPSK